MFVKSAYEIKKRPEMRSTAQERERRLIDAQLRPTVGPDQLQAVSRYETVQKVIKGEQPKPRVSEDVSPIDAIILRNSDRFKPLSEDEENAPYQREVYYPVGGAAVAAKRV